MLQARGNRCHLRKYVLKVVTVYYIEMLVIISQTKDMQIDSKVKIKPDKLGTVIISIPFRIYR